MLELLLQFWLELFKTKVGPFWQLVRDGEQQGVPSDMH